MLLETKLAYNYNIAKVPPFQSTKIRKSALDLSQLKNKSKTLFILYKR